ncbi:hypothetical protein [Bradyrhizobium sp. CB1015]|uniref:hypothetical protein n=1 Tax=Bradyrhizobium sp. CB1015 TaxID=2976822 RepID=UPI0021AA17A9|nr:hypothetical protein [Bradyrhizobium sp. CB1015]UWU89294.1 hypothetical protein N2604_22570 [Bradyrhizobium sp. CB1015]
MVAGSNPARGAKFCLELNGLRSHPHAVHDLLSLIFEHSSAESRSNRCVSASSRHSDGAKSTQFTSSVDSPDISELIPMPDIQVDRSDMAPSILPAGIPELSDDECLACLARAVEAPDSARLDEVAALIGRLAVAIE